MQVQQHLCQGLPLPRANSASGRVRLVVLNTQRRQLQRKGFCVNQALPEQRDQNCLNNVVCAHLEVITQLWACATDPKADIGFSKISKLPMAASSPDRRRSSKRIVRFATDLSTELLLKRLFNVPHINGDCHSIRVASQSLFNTAFETRSRTRSRTASRA